MDYYGDPFHSSMMMNVSKLVKLLLRDGKSANEMSLVRVENIEEFFHVHFYFTFVSRLIY
jgi:hypothetical protein